MVDQADRGLNIMNMKFAVFDKQVAASISGSWESIDHRLEMLDIREDPQFVESMLDIFQYESRGVS